jgi:type I site-specific restriction endonuclease
LNEQAKREAFVFPVVNAVAAVTNALIRIEQPLKISEQLQGEVDYILSVKHLQNLVIIEAKRGDLDYGFTQLAAELIAIDQWDQAPAVADQPIIIGAVTMGDLWRFGMLDRQQQQIAEDIGSFRVPEDLDPILRILIQALTT